MDDGNTFLLICLRNDPPDIKMAQLRNFRDYDWNSILDASNKYKMTPILYYVLRQLSPHIRIPAQVQQKLRESYHRSTARNMRVYQQLLKLVRIFNHEGVRVILLKGAHLAKLVYGNSALRPMGDLDLLVRNTDLLRASELLAEQGYTPSQEHLDRPLDICHLPTFNKAESVPVEIHFNIVGPPFSQKFDVAELWERAQKEFIQGVEVSVLCPEDLFLHICVHACTRHGFDNGITPFVDITRTLECYQKEIEWDKILTKSRKWGASRCVYVMLALSKKLLGAPVPGNVLPKIMPDSDDFDAMTSAEQLMFEKSSPIVTNLARLFGNDPWSDKFRLFMKRAFPAPETMPVVEGPRGNKLSICLMYFARLKGIWKRHSKTAWRALLKDRNTSSAVAIENKRNRLKEWFQIGQ
jgi:hypothetical protein